MSKKSVVQYAKDQGYEQSLNATIESLLVAIEAKGYTRKQARAMLAGELSAGWNRDAILDGVDRVEERAREESSQGAK